MEYKENQLKINLVTKRCINNNMSLDEASKQIGISKATLSRLEKGKMPDMETFGKCCTWLNDFPNNYFAFNSEKELIDFR